MRYAVPGVVGAALAGRLVTSILLRFRGGGGPALDPGDLYLFSLGTDVLSPRRSLPSMIFRTICGLFFRNRAIVLSLLLRVDAWVDPKAHCLAWAFGPE